MSIGNPSIVSPPLKDRSVGLILFGAIQIFLGCLSALMIPLMLLPLLAGAPPGVPANMQTDERGVRRVCGIFALGATVLCRGKAGGKASGAGGLMMTAIFVAQSREQLTS